MSRIVRGISLLLADGSQMPLRRLFPRDRFLLKVHLRQILREERTEMAAGVLAGALSDQTLAGRIRERSHLACSRRTATDCRKALGIPNSRERTGRGCYLTATRNFSAVYPLNRQAVRTLAPRSPGVYELRLARGTIEYPMGSSPVFYLGSAGDLRKRLRDHLGPNGKNPCVRTRRDGAAFRFACLKPGWKKEERRVYNRFRGTFGSSPKCNKSKP